MRVSYGELGNQQIGGSNLDVNISDQNEFIAYYNFNGAGLATPGATLISKGNPELTWETMTAMNFAFDMGFFDNKLQATIDVFKNETNGLVGEDTQKISTTAIDSSAPFTNLGSMQSTGFDLSLSYNDVTSSGFRYGISANVTRAINEVTELISDFYSASGDRVGSISRTEAGQP